MMCCTSVTLGEASPVMAQVKKFAVTEVGAFMMTEVGLEAPDAPPLQKVNGLDPLGVAVTVTLDPASKKLLDVGLTLPSEAGCAAVVN